MADKRLKQVEKVLRNPKDVSFDEISRLLVAFGYACGQASGSHYTFRKAGTNPITVPKNKPSKKCTSSTSSACSIWRPGMKRTVEEYVALPYAIEITPDEGSYFVKIKELDGCMSVGDTPADALTMIEDAKHAWLTAALEDGIDIPLPEAMQTDRYSGKFALRLPKSQHRKLAEGAERDEVSLNQYIVTLLAERNPLAEVRRLLSERDQAPYEVPEVETAMSITTKSPNVLPFRRRVVGG